MNFRQKRTNLFLNLVITSNFSNCFYAVFIFQTRSSVLIIDDSMFERNRFKKVELLAKVYDHAKYAYKFGFRMLTLGWSDGNTFLPVNSIFLSTENKKNRINEATAVDKRNAEYQGFFQGL